MEVLIKLATVANILIKKIGYNNCPNFFTLTLHCFSLKSY